MSSVGQAGVCLGPGQVLGRPVGARRGVEMGKVGQAGGVFPGPC